jgi:hypothetical protein
MLGNAKAKREYKDMVVTRFDSISADVQCVASQNEGVLKQLTRIERILYNHWTPRQVKMKLCDNSSFRYTIYGGRHKHLNYQSTGSHSSTRTARHVLRARLLCVCVCACVSVCERERESSDPLTHPLTHTHSHSRHGSHATHMAQPQHNCSYCMTASLRAFFARYVPPAVVHKHIHIQIYVHNIHTDLHHTYIHVFTYIHTYIRTYIHTYIYILHDASCRSAAMCKSILQYLQHTYRHTYIYILHDTSCRSAALCKSILQYLQLCLNIYIYSYIYII